MEKNKNIKLNSGYPAIRKPNKKRNNNKPRATRPYRAVESALRTSQFVEPQRITDFRNKSGDELLREMRIYNRYVKNRYLVGLIHPDIAVKQQIPVKLYSDVPIPTASIGFHEQYEFTTSSVGTFLLSWRPNLLFGTADLATYSLTDYSHLTYNNSSSLVGNAVTAGNYFVAGSYAPAVGMQRYRLVSALLKCSYNGSVINQAGTMISCATFDPFAVAAGTAGSAVSTFADGLVDRFGKFSLITNALWNTTKDITNNSDGLEHLYIPTDPNDYTFSIPGSYYNKPVTNLGVTTAPIDGAHINYVVAGRNLPNSSSCIIVDIYYNYEVIADPTAAPFLRSAPDTVFDSRDRDELHDAISGVIKTGSLIKPASNGLDFKKILMDVAQAGISYLPKLLSAL